jgi:hypothetical protein
VGAANQVPTSDAQGNAIWQTPADASATNELQTLSIAGSTITLSGSGGVLTVPSSADNLSNHNATTNHGLGWYGSGKLWNVVNFVGPVLYG